jgi:hypothetical protein
MKFEHEARVTVPPDVVFGLTQDHAQRLTWDPFLSHAELLGGAATPAVGVAWFSPEPRLRVAAPDRAIASGQR